MIRLVCVAALACCGCQSGGGDGDTDMATSGQGDIGGGGGADGGGADGGAVDMAGPAPDALFTPLDGCDAVIHTVRGQLVVEDGAGLAMAKAQLCLRSEGSASALCLRPADTGPDGRFEVSVPEDARCITGAVMRNLRPGAQLATSFCELALPDNSHTVRAPPFVMFATTPATDLPPEGDATQPRTVAFEAGLEIDIVPDVLYTGASAAYPILSAAKIPPDADLCLQIDRRDFAGIYAFSPEADIDGDGAGLRVQTELAEGTSVALHVLGGLNCTIGEEQLHEAAWSQFATATVGANGLIETPPGPNGLPCLNWLAYEVL